MSVPPYPCLAIDVVQASVDDVARRLHLLGSSGIEIRDRDTMTPREGALLLAGFPDAVTRDAALACMAGVGGCFEARPVDVAEDGWATRWREFFRPVVLERLQVVTPWMAPPHPDHPSIVVDPGMAFGTGGHPTTRLILEMLERRFAGPAPPRRVLDLGTGSGVLAIAAVALGAGQAHGIDVDPGAVAVAEQNARINAVSDRATFAAGSPEGLGGAWPLVMANIELPVFESSAAAIAALVAAGGGLLVSGLLEDQAAFCRSLFAGFEVTEERALDGWSALALVRR